MPGGKDYTSLSQSPGKVMPSYENSLTSGFRESEGWDGDLAFTIIKTLTLF